MPDTGQKDNDKDDARGGTRPAGPVVSAMASRIAAGELSPDDGPVSYTHLTLPTT